ncbi:hypothetical protein J1N35_024111 [Gossypium stocksii]|uniref:Lipoxygenase domain-containing protein n=1 Tax=Gossypium stocksii TaxID=47602 RepID=A0A9D3VJA6_9ROSI|nr:hypothetical protein J1N35_024111 [Gossypium stocksii]
MVAGDEHISRSHPSMYHHWIASAFLATANFGQYPLAGYLPNRPTVSRRFMPEPGTKEYDELKNDPDLAFLKIITAQFQTLLGV